MAPAEVSEFGRCEHRKMKLVGCRFGVSNPGERIGHLDGHGPGGRRQSQNGPNRYSGADWSSWLYTRDYTGVRGAIRSVSAHPSNE